MALFEEIITELICLFSPSWSIPSLMFTCVTCRCGVPAPAGPAGWSPGGPAAGARGHQHLQRGHIQGGRGGQGAGQHAGTAASVQQYTRVSQICQIAFYPTLS